MKKIMKSNEKKEKNSKIKNLLKPQQQKLFKKSHFSPQKSQKQ